jgi:hypothetical protein
MKAVNNINVDVNAPVEIKGSILSIFQNLCSNTDNIVNQIKNTLIDCHPFFSSAALSLTLH